MDLNIPRFSPRGLIVNFEFGHEGLFEGGLFEGRRAIKNFSGLRGGLIKTTYCLRGYDFEKFRKRINYA